jgi:hypothetical protein
MEILDELRGPRHLDPTNPSTSLAHLQHVFEGYRTRIRETDETVDATGGYSPDSARRISFDMGFAMAEADLALRGK